MALMMRQESIDFGKVQVDHSRQEYAHGLITNIGGEPMSINKITVVGEPQYNAPEGTFTYRLPSDPKLIPLPIDITIPGDHFATGGATAKGAIITLGKDLKDSELLKMEKGKDCKNKEITLVKPVLPGTALNLFGDPSLSETLAEKTLTVYGERLELDGQFAFYKNPKADFASKARANIPAGKERLIAHTAYNERTLPIDLFPGESIDVLIKATPQATGDLFAYLIVEATSLWNPHGYVPWMGTSLRVRGLYGPNLNFVPSVVNLPRQLGVHEYWESLVAIDNYGDLPLTRRDFKILGVDATRFSLVTSHVDTLIMQPGQTELFNVRYTPRICGFRKDPVPQNRWHRAVLQINSDGGTAVIPLKGDGETCMKIPKVERPATRYIPPPPRMRTMDR
jgi:hypothetical protein